MTDTKPKKLGEADFDGQKLPVWEIEIDAAAVDAKSLIELTDEFRPGCFVFASVLFNQPVPTYPRWVHQGGGEACCPSSLHVGQWVAWKQSERAPWRHYYLVDATPSRLVAIGFPALPARWLSLNEIRSGLRTCGIRLRSVDPALKFKFLPGAAGRPVTLAALIQPGNTPYGLLCEATRADDRRWEKTRTTTLSRGPRPIARKDDRIRLNRIGEFVGAVLDGVLAANPDWTPLAQKFEAYFERFTPQTAEWLQAELLAGAPQGANPNLVEAFLDTGDGEGTAKLLEVQRDQARQRRAETMRSKAAEVMTMAPPRPVRNWTLKEDGIYLDGPWDDVLGSRLRELKAKWLRPGWRVALRHAKAVAELLREYPNLKAHRQE